ncbi:hypothetical protein [Halobacillus salinus]|uniref:hypothetical protein n=1 Tax=Halobacillus salinus TaxID=192814 RepID=UPI0009A6E91B|nr:hypothetical protein [Halobacillus salinus]
MKRSRAYSLLKKGLPFLTIVFLVYGIYVHMQYQQLHNRLHDPNQDRLGMVIHISENLTANLEEFIKLQNYRDQPKVKEDMDQAWRMVMGQKESIDSNLNGMIVGQTDEQSNLNLLRHSLVNVNRTLIHMTEKFLEQQSYALKQEEKQKLIAVLNVYERMQEYRYDEVIHVYQLLQSIKGPIHQLDPHTADMLKEVDP